MDEVITVRLMLVSVALHTFYVIITLRVWQVSSINLVVRYIVLPDITR